MLKMSLELSIYAPGSSGFSCLAPDVTADTTGWSGTLP